MRVNDMIDKPLVSIRIPSYNHEKYIYDCISSVLNQTFQDFEIVIVDDCSTDGTVNVIQKFNDKRIKLEVLNKNSGMNVAVERCMQKCVGKYVANISSDDMWESTKLEKQVVFLENNKNFDAVFTRVEFIGEDGHTLNDKVNKYSNIFDCENRDSSQWLRKFFYEGNCLCNPSVMIKRKVYESLNYQDKRLVSLSDFDLWIKFCLNHQLWILDEKLTKFRIRDNEMNLSADTSGNRSRMAFEYKQILDNYLLIKDPELLVNIFPECLNFGNPKETTIPYFLGRLAIDCDLMFRKLWGCEKIYALMSDNKIAEYLEKNYNFRYVDFLALTKMMNFSSLLNSVSMNKTIERRKNVYDTVKQLLKRISPRSFKAIKGIYLRFKQ